MPIPSGFDNKVVLVTGSPVDTTDLNAELATQNAADYIATSLVFLDANTVAMLFGKAFGATYGYPIDQKVNLVMATQVDVDADKATETATGYWPTGVFTDPGGDLLILYQLIDEPPA